jgi:16S rRNA (guanine1516-N2)-methyltransferase
MARQRVEVDGSSFAPPQRGSELAAELGLPTWTVGSQATFVLREVNGVLGLHAVREHWQPLVVDFSQENTARRSRGERSLQPLVRALGERPSNRLTVLDATAGLGRDALLLATAGCRVVAVERSPVVFAVLRDGIRRGRCAELLDLVHADARDLLVAHGAYAFDVVYLDPMYPETESHALPKRELQFLRAVLGDDADAAEVCGLALRLAGRRVLVKRPLAAPPLVAGVTHAFLGKLVRIDMYDCGQRHGASGS